MSAAVVRFPTPRPTEELLQEIGRLYSTCSDPFLLEAGRAVWQLREHHHLDPVEQRTLHWALGVFLEIHEKVGGSPTPLLQWVLNERSPLRS